MKNNAQNVMLSVTRNLQILACIALVAVSFAFFQPKALAMDCYIDPVTELQGKATVISAVFIREKACSGQGVNFAVLPKGAVVELVGETDGWYYAAYNGTRGWVGAQFLLPSSLQEGKVWGSYDDFMQAYPAQKGAASAPSPTTVSFDYALVNRLKGRILLQTQSHGEAWYLNPVDGARYYMQDGPTAYQMMRAFGLGVSEIDYAKIAAGNYTLKSRLRGRIILRAQAHGEAYYIHPATLAVHYLQDGPTAYQLMRYYSLGISNADLARIPAKELTW